MKKSIILILSLIFLSVSVGCSQSKLISSEMDLDEPSHERWSGTITNIFTEGGGADLAEVIELEIKDHEPMYFTIIKETEYLRYDSDTGEMEEITDDELHIGDRVEIDCESDQNSSYHPIVTIQVIEPAK
jgi:hypothetical protein